MENAAKKGIEVEALLSRPGLSRIQIDILEAFWFLNQRRPVMGLGTPGAIPLPEIESYCRIYRIEDPEYFSDLISNTDVKFLALILEKGTD